MALEDVPTPETALDRIRKLAFRIQQDIARYNLGEAKQDVNQLEQLCSFLYTYQNSASHKKSKGIILSSFEHNTLMKMDVESCVVDYLPTLKFVIDRMYPDENMYGYKMPFVKNLKQTDMNELLWKIMDSLKLGSPELVSEVEHKSIFTEIG